MFVYKYTTRIPQPRKRFQSSVHDESLNAFEDEITKGDTVNENTPNSKEFRKSHSPGEKLKERRV